MLTSKQNVNLQEETLTGERTTETDAPTISLSALCECRHEGWLPPGTDQLWLISPSVQPSKMTSLWLNYACKPSPLTQSALQKLWEVVPQVAAIQLPVPALNTDAQPQTLLLLLVMHTLDRHATFQPHHALPQQKQLQYHAADVCSLCNPKEVMQQISG